MFLHQGAILMESSF